MSKEPFSDHALDEAAQRAFDAMLDSLPPPSQCQHTFSLEFEANMAKLIAKDKRRRALRAAAKRAAMIAVTCLVGAGSFLATNTQARAAVSTWFKTRHDTFFSYNFSGEVASAAPAMLPVAEYRPGWLPEGYTERGWSSYDHQVVVEYVQESSGLLSFGYIPEAQALTAQEQGLDVTGLTHAQAEVNGQSADLYTPDQPGGETVLLWDLPAYCTACYLCAELPAEELLQIAESVTLSNADALPSFSAGSAPVFEPLYTLASVPADYVLEDRWGDALGCNSLYRNLQTGQVFTFDVFYTHAGVGMSVSMEEDEFEYQAVRVDGLRGEFYRAVDESHPSFLMWVDEDNGIAFNLNGCFTLDEMLALAGSVTRNA